MTEPHTGGTTYSTVDLESAATPTFCQPVTGLILALFTNLDWYLCCILWLSCLMFPQKSLNFFAIHTLNLIKSHLENCNNTI